MGSTSSSKIGHDFRSGSKFEVRNFFFLQKWSSKLIFLNGFFFEKITSIFDIEN